MVVDSKVSTVASTYFSRCSATKYLMSASTIFALRSEIAKAGQIGTSMFGFYVHEDERILA